MIAKFTLLYRRLVTYLTTRKRIRRKNSLCSRALYMTIPFCNYDIVLVFYS